MTGIYTITHRSSGRSYLGSSVDIDKRWVVHRSSLNRGTHHSPYLQRVWSKHGAAAFDFEVLCETTRAELRREERRLIRERQPAFNCMRAMVEGPLRHSPATREKLSAAQYRLWQERRDAGTDTLSEEHKARIAEAHRGLTHTDAAKAKMSASAKTRPPISDETRRKLSESGKRQKGRKFTAEHKAKLSAARKGKRHSDEQRAKIAASLKRAYDEGRR
jgi:group I intron endonuclease